MKRQTFQHPELRDANDNIIQEGTYGKESPLVNSTNDGVLDYINNNLEALHDNINGSRIYVASKAALPATGDLSAMYIAEDTGKWYLWDGTKYIETDNARKIADEAIAARDAAKASQTAAKTSETNAKTSESNAAASKTAAAGSASAAKTSETNAKTSETNAAASKTAAASSASAAAGSASAAKTSETNAASSKSAAATSATNAANSAKAAATSATAAANSAREQQADWNVTDTNSKAFVKNKPAVYPKAAKVESEAPVDTPTDLVYAKCGTSDRFHIRVGGAENAGWVELATGDDNAEPIYVRQYKWNTSDSQKDGYFGALVREAVLLDGDGNTSFPHTVTAQNFTGLASKATADAAGNNIQNTYVRKSDLSSSVSTTSLTVTGATSVPTANAGNSSKAIANTEFVAKSISALVNGAPDQLNTLNELAKALGNDSNFASTVTAELAKKLNSAEAESTYATKQEARVLPGTVTAFSGTFKDGYPVDKNTGLVDKEWHLCDGTNGTPDLRNRFIYGSDGTNNGATGGEASVTLNVSNIPSHGHMIRTWNNVSSGYPLVYRNGSWERWTAGCFKASGEWKNDGGNTATAPQNGQGDPAGTTDGTGGNQPHNNMPPYYTLAFIMKI